MARDWMILARVIRVGQAQAGHGEAAAMHAGAEAHAVLAAQALAEVPAVAEPEQAVVGEGEDDAAPGEAEVAAARAHLEESLVRVDAVPVQDATAANNLGQPGFIVSVEPPPRVTFVTARLVSLPDDLTKDTYPYIIACGSFSLLAHFATAPYYGTDFREALVGAVGRRPPLRHLAVVRYFRRVGGEIAATAVPVPARPRAVFPLKNIESIGLVCDGYNDRRTYKYRIAELKVDTGRRPSLDLAIFRSDRAKWFMLRELESPLAQWDDHRRWVPHGAVAVHSIVMWFDLSWGILCCDVDQEPEELQVQFYRLPRGRGLRKGGATDDIHTKRCIAVSRDMLRYVEIIPDPIPNGQAARVCMWSLTMGKEELGWRWIANFSVSIQDIWNDNSYAQTRLQREVPVLAGVCPANPDVVYFELRHRLFGVNMPERRVVDYQANEHELVNVPGLQTQTGSSRYLLAWNMLRPGRDEPIIGHMQPGLPHDGFPDEPKDKELQDPKGKSKATGGRRKSTSASSSSRPSKALRIK